MNTKIKLPKNLKIAFFDFDNTLALHIDNEYVERLKRYGEDKYYANAFEFPDVFYENIEQCIASVEMVELVNYLRKKGVKLCCLTGMKTSLNAQAKKNFIKNHYGDDFDFYSAGTQSLKRMVVRIIREVNKYKPEEVIFVDDLAENIEMMRNDGVFAILANDVKNIVYEDDREENY